MRLFPMRKAKAVAPAARHIFDAPISPDCTFAVIGDIHGCDRLLESLLAMLDGENLEYLVFVGDYVDRGEESAQVVRRLFAMSETRRDRCVFLKGNHEDMMLRFLEAPETNGPRWFKHGGLQTLASFGIGFSGAKADLVKTREALRDAIGPDLLAWLQRLPASWQSGNVAVVHAGADPDSPIALQPVDTLIWGHPAFARRARGDGTWIVHGHTIVDEVTADQGRIGVDTGAYATGRLSAALLGPGTFALRSASYRQDGTD